MAAKRYLWAWFVATATLLLAVAMTNLLVDPYDLFRVVDGDGFNRVKSRASQRLLMFKRTNVERMQPNTLILGNSRAEIGFDPDSSAWPASFRPVFNLAIPGSGPRAALDELQRVRQTHALRLVVVGLDFVDFRVDPAARGGIGLPAVQGETAWQSLGDAASALLTIDAFVDSLGTLKAQHDRYSAELTRAGFNPMRDYDAIARREGYYAMFRQRNQENARNYARGWKSIYSADGRPSPAFDAVSKIIASAHERKIAVRLVIYPYHAQTLVLFHESGLWPAFEAWKRELVTLVQAAPTGTDIELWDFTSFAPYADEPVPARGDTTSRLQWYWEAGHFTKAHGDILLARLFDGRRHDSAWGRRVSPDSIEAQIRELRGKRDDYERSHPAEVQDLAAMVESARSK